jgi:hypothetical protein
MLSGTKMIRLFQSSWYWTPVCHNDAGVQMNNSEKCGYENYREMDGPKASRLRYGSRHHGLQQAAKDEFFLDGCREDETEENHPGRQL